MLLVPEGQMGATWEPSKKKQRFFGNREAWDRKVLSLSDSFSLKGQICYGRRPTSYTA
jgi:hypothetical protein